MAVSHLNRKLLLWLLKLYIHCRVKCSRVFPQSVFINITICTVKLGPSCKKPKKNLTYKVRKSLKWGRLKISVSLFLRTCYICMLNFCNFLQS